MPQRPGQNRKAISGNIRELRKAGHTQRQAATTLNNVRRRPTPREKRVRQLEAKNVTV